jgi:PAS domain S-box-containing protein
MRRSKKNSERAEQIRRNTKKTERVEPLRPQAEQIRKFDNDLVKFPEENPYPVLRVHKDGTVLYANKASEPLLKANGSGVGLPAPQQWRRLTEESITSGRPAEEIIEHEGHIFGFKLVPVAGSDYVNFYGMDITERKKAEERVKAERQRLYDVLETLPVMVCLLTPDYHVAFTNSVFRQKFGEDKGRFCFDYIFGRKGPCEFCEAHNVLKTGKPHHWECTGPDGCSIIDVYDFPFTDTDGSPLILEMDIDITEQKQAEQALKKSNQLLRDTGEMAEVGGWELDLSTKEVFCTEETCRIHGVEPGHKPKLEEAVNFYAPESRPALKEALKKAAETGEPYDLESLFIPSGSKDKIWVRSLGRAVYSGGKIVKLAGTFQNIDKYKRAEKALRESEEKFKTLADEAFDSIVIHDGGRIVEANKTFGEKWGYKPEQADGLRVDDLIAPEWVKVVKEKIRCGYDKPYEVVAIRKDGTRFPVEIVGNPTTYKGRPVRIATARDITERKRAEEEILWKTALLESQVEANLDGVLVVDSNNQKILTNKRLIELLKVPQHIVEDKDDTALLQYAVSQTKYPEQFLEKVKYLYSHQDKTSRDEIEFKNGMVFDRYSSPVVDKNGKYFGRIWTFRDITDRKLAEEALQISETRFRELFNNMSSGVAVYEAVDDGSDFVFKDFNMAGQRMEKTSREDAVGKRVTEIFPGVKEMGLLDVLRRVWQTGRAEQHPTTLYKDGRISGWRENNVYKLPSGEIVAVYDDVTERKWAEEKLLKYQRQLKQLTSQLALTEERERRRIAGELHDQLCQSLALAKIRLDAIRSSGKSKPVEEELGQVSDAMQSLIDQTRSLIFDIGSPVLYELGLEEAVADWLNEQLHAKYGFVTEFQDDGKEKPLDDDVKVLLFRNVRELLINVIKHSRASKVKVSIRRTDDSIEITVKDNGIGFNPAPAPVFRQEDAGAGKAAKFGLFSIRESIEQLGGHFEIESKPGGGCTAKITAPLKKTNS